MSEEIARIAIALIAVLGMIGGGAMLAKRMGFAAPGGALGGKKRLSVVETMALDARRRVAIIRCDDAEHLIMLGASGETVVASDIKSLAETIQTPAEEQSAREASPTPSGAPGATVRNAA